MGPAPDASTAHVLGRLDVIRLRVGEVVASRRSLDAVPDDPFLGLYLSDERIDELLRNERTWASGEVAVERRRQVEAAADAAAERGERIRLRELADRFELDYGYLNDDVGRRRASVALALGLTGIESWRAEGRARLGPGANLVRRGLVEVQDADRPFLTRPLHVPDRVIAHVLGDDHPDRLLHDLIVDVAPSGELIHEDLVRALGLWAPFAYLRDVNGQAVNCSVDSAAAAGRSWIVIDLDRLVHRPDVSSVVGAIAREARLLGAVLIAGPVDDLAQQALSDLQHLTASITPLILHGRVGWDPGWARTTPLVIEPPPLGRDARQRLWSAALDGSGSTDVDPATLTSSFHLGAEQIRVAAEAAVVRAAAAERTVSDDDVRAGARQQNAARLERLAQRIEPAVGWDDLVLPDNVLGLLRGLVTRARHRELVLAEWKMRPGGARGTGITALFAGDSGTGKTMSAEVVAKALGLDLYVVNLATVVDKYIGETEKNLDRIFGEADNVNGVLLFDEADALFGQRSEVRDSHDRYANIEVAYLLQRMEQFDGLAVLSTNLRSNIDDAFMRRLDVVVDFQVPDAVQRRRLWAKCLARLDQSDDIDLDFCAEAFDLTGGNIRSIAVTTAYQAATERRPIEMRDVIAAVAEEYRKLGRLCLEAEFGRYWHLVAS